MNPIVLQKIKSFCAYQERSHKSVRTKLIAFGSRGNEIEQIIALLIEENYLNEERFACLFAGSKFRIKKWGRERIVQELKMQGISAYCIQKALKEINSENYRQTIESLAVKKIDSFTRNPGQRDQQKLFNYLRNKGFESSLCAEIVRKHYG